ncbi:Z1 domain-containing protein [Paractinoplanes maris]|uniref:Z1 domain-containing protein n=1 Tax=Paractinoplanes maris TaxID=1734446 RepID=UPI00202225A6|nr:Z1 domain-containing protein [Actinoplanes maris]
MTIAAWETALDSAVTGLRKNGPSALLKPMNAYLDDDLPPATADDLEQLLLAHNQQSSAALRHLALLLAEWDLAEDPAWKAEGTAPRTAERRQWVYERLRLPAGAAARLDLLAPVATVKPPGPINEEWVPWYEGKRLEQWAFYWPHYRDYLLDQRGWHGGTVAELDEATTKVIRRIADPTKAGPAEHLQKKGLVVGYVQSGKTANFTGVIAKAIDAGYRLVIVMTGTIELLRSQTQRRIDRELVGRENLLEGVESETAAEFDYADDEGWAQDEFVRHGDGFGDLGYPAIERLTRLNKDFDILTAGPGTMKLYPKDSSRPYYDPVNLQSAPVRLLVVKKNAHVLRKLAKDLAKSKGLDQLPTLIVDDESDLASVNTKNPAKTDERTAINQAIVDLLKRLPRAQLVMYTATPAANVFVDPQAEGIFPRNFILPLPEPADYMGVRHFHDVEWNSEDPKDDPATSNEVAYIRRVGPPPETADDLPQREAEMLAALDSFVLAGAIKVFREQAGAAHYRHHTMLVHETVRNDDHEEMAELVLDVWKKADYTSAASLARLEALWESDYRPVCRARSGGYPVPGSFDDLIGPMGEAYRRIREVRNPVLIVNSDEVAQRNQQELDFDRNKVWRILIGGAKLSRGFTVEGLTISFYTRRALQGDTLMQAGRWFGFRPGYRDLVRLYIRRDPAGTPKRVDLYEAFEGLMRDEMALRESLAEYESVAEDGSASALEPWQVPPIVSQHLPYLRPAARTKMFNAVIRTVGESGSLKDRYGVPAQDDDEGKRTNYDLIVPLLARAGRENSAHFVSSRGPKVEGTFEAKVLPVEADAFVRMLEQLRWNEGYREVIDPVVRFYRRLLNQGRLNQAVVVWPQLKNMATYDFPGLGPAQAINKKRRSDRPDTFPGSDPKHRNALNRLAGSKSGVADVTADALCLEHGKPAGLLVYLTLDREDPLPAGSPVSKHDVVPLLSLVAPADSTPNGRSTIEWTVKGAQGEATVDLTP